VRTQGTNVDHHLMTAADVSGRAQLAKCVNANLPLSPPCALQFPTGILVFQMPGRGTAEMTELTGAEATLSAPLYRGEARRDEEEDSEADGTQHSDSLVFVWPGGPLDRRRHEIFFCGGVVETLKPEEDPPPRRHRTNKTGASEREEVSRSSQPKQIAIAIAITERDDVEAMPD
jgi:hypothetical protein